MKESKENKRGLLALDIPFLFLFIFLPVTQFNLSTPCLADPPVHPSVPLLLPAAYRMPGQDHDRTLGLRPKEEAPRMEHK